MEEIFYRSAEIFGMLHIFMINYYYFCIFSRPSLFSDAPESLFDGWWRGLCLHVVDLLS